MDLQSEDENEYMEMHEDAETQTQRVGESESHTQSHQSHHAQSLKRRLITVYDTNKHLKAYVWKEFEAGQLGPNGKKRGGCIHYGKKLIVEPAQGTSALSRHLSSCLVRPPKFGEDRMYDPKVDRDMKSDIIICHDLPFKYVEYEKARERDEYLNPNVQHICRQTAAADVFRRYESEKEKLKLVLAGQKGRVSFTSDLWTSQTSMVGYICLTAHYVDESWRLNNKILAFCEMKPPHTGAELASKVLSCLKEWGLEKKVFTLTLDNANSNDSMQRILKHRLSPGLLCDGDFFHVRCCAHILNLIVQKALELVNKLVENIRESVKYVNGSTSRIDAFAACAQSAGVKRGAGLSLDVSTRWNSTYDMLVRALRFREAFKSLQICDRNYKWLPSEDEWDRGEKICALLQPFSTITKYFSGVKYPTAKIYFIQVWKIEKLLIKYSHCGDDGVKQIAESMKLKFDKYWKQYSVILAMAAVLDPRLKLQILKTAFDEVDPSTSKHKIEVVKDNLRRLYEEYKTKSGSGLSSDVSSSSQNPLELLTESPLEDDVNYDLLELEKKLDPSLDNVRSNLDTYLDDDRLEMKTFADIDVLSYWKESGQRYGDLAMLARDLLSVPITTVASESAFSIGGRVLSPFRNRLLPSNVQALLCARNWTEAMHLLKVILKTILMIKRRMIQQVLRQHEIRSLCLYVELMLEL